MNDHVYKTIEITGTSRKKPEDAIRLAINVPIRHVLSGPNISDHSS